MEMAWMAAIGCAEAYETDDPDKWAVVSTMLGAASRSELEDSYVDLLSMLIAKTREWSLLVPALAGLSPSEVLRLEWEEA